MNRVLAFLYGVVSYVIFLCTFLYAIAFVSNVLAPKSIDSVPTASLGQALFIDAVLLAIFAVQHSLMARQGFKKVWTRIVPPAVERSTYVLAATLALALILTQWRPIAEPVIWRVENPMAVQAVWAVFWLGWAVLLLATFLINHFELFGLRQVFSRLVGREIPESEFRTPLLYRYVRHPIYLGFLLGFYAAPVMTAGPLLFAIGATGYILVGIWFEERDLVAQFGERYRQYRNQVGMLLPFRKAQ
jgi:methanethiol S-methyltransferase